MDLFKYHHLFNHGQVSPEHKNGAVLVPKFVWLLGKVFFLLLLILYPSLAAESQDCFTENRSQASTSESTIGTRTSSTVNEDKAQLKFCAKSYLPARINSTALESISVLFQCRISHAQAYEKVTSPQVWASHAGLQCCFMCLFSVRFSEPHYRLSDSAHSSPTWAKFLLRVASFFFSFFFLTHSSPLDALHRVPTVDSH